MFDSSLVFIPLVFVSPSESMFVSEVVSRSFVFSFSSVCCFFPQNLWEIQNDNAFVCTCKCAILSLLVSPHPLSFLYLMLCVSVWMCVQSLQRTWKRASGRWRGSCCSSRRTWRLSPPPMTPATCFSAKWSYPFHIYAFAHWSGAVYGGFTVSEQRYLSDTFLGSITFKLDVCSFY